MNGLKSVLLSSKCCVPKLTKCCLVSYVTTTFHNSNLLLYNVCGTCVSFIGLANDLNALRAQGKREEGTV